MAYYRQTPPPQYGTETDFLYQQVLAKLTNGLLFAALTSGAMVVLSTENTGLFALFLVLGIVGYIVSIIGYFFAKNENTINTLYYIFVGSSSVFLGATFTGILQIDGGAEIILGSFGITAMIVGYIWNKVETERPDPAYAGRNITKYSLIFIGFMLLSWFVVFSEVVYLIFSIFGAALFSLYFYYDLARLMKGQIRSPARMAWNLYWDVLLIFRYILRIMMMVMNRK